MATRSIVKITTRDSDGQIVGSGSGFIIAKDRIATSFHVVSSAWSATANYSNGESVVVEGIVSANVSQDVALVAASTGRRPSLVFGDSTSVRSGDKIIVMGAPLGLAGTVSEGIISAVRVVDGLKILQTTAPVSPGSSGGPFLDDTGRVIGMTTFQYTVGQNLNFAVSSYYAKTLLQKPWPKPVTLDAFQTIVQSQASDDSAPRTELLNAPLSTDTSAERITELQDTVVELLGGYGLTSLGGLTKVASATFPNIGQVVLESKQTFDTSFIDEDGSEIGGGTFANIVQLTNLDPNRITIIPGNQEYTVSCPTLGDRGAVSVVQSTLKDGKSVVTEGSRSSINITVSNIAAASKLRLVLRELINLLSEGN